MLSVTNASGKPLWIGIIVIGTALAAVVALPMLIERPSAPANNANAREIVLAPLADMPPDVQSALPEVQEAYRFAVANQELVSQFPCFCGCVYMGHENNLDCYIQEVQDDGTIVFESHASL